MERLLRNVKHPILFFRFRKIKKNNRILVKNLDTTLDYCIEHKVSVSRFGDGEFRWIMKIKNDSFQDVNDQLSKKLEEVLNSKIENHIVCIPDVFDGVSEYTAKNSMAWKNFIVSYQDQLGRIINTNHVYYDANITRPYIDQRDKKKAKQRFEKLKEIWKDKKVLIVEGKLTRFGINNDLLDATKKVDRIVCPPKNAFESYEKILDTTIKFFEKGKYDLVLVALGPTASILAYDLARNGIQSIDIGHADIEYEWFKKKAKNRVPILGKYVNEVPEGRRVTLQVGPSEYSREIIAEVK